MTLRDLMKDCAAALAAGACIAATSVWGSYLTLPF